MKTLWVVHKHQVKQVPSWKKNTNLSKGRFGDVANVISIFQGKLSPGFSRRSLSGEENHMACPQQKATLPWKLAQLLGAPQHCPLVSSANRHYNKEKKEVHKTRKLTSKKGNLEDQNQRMLIEEKKVLWRKGKKKKKGEPKEFLLPPFCFLHFGPQIDGAEIHFLSELDALLCISSRHFVCPFWQFSSIITV